MMKTLFIVIYLLITQSLQAANLCNLQHPETCRAAIIQQLAKFGVIIDEKTGAMNNENLDEVLSHLGESSGIWSHKSGYAWDLKVSSVLTNVMKEHSIDSLVQLFLGNGNTQSDYFSFGERDENPAALLNTNTVAPNPIDPPSQHDKAPRTETSELAKTPSPKGAETISVNSNDLNAIPLGNKDVNTPFTIISSIQPPQKTESKQKLSNIQLQSTLKNGYLHPDKNVDSQQHNNMHSHEKLMHNLTVLQKLAPDNKTLQGIKISTAHGQYPGKTIGKDNINKHFIAYTIGKSDSYNTASRFVDSENNVWLCALSGLYNRRITDKDNQILEKIGHSETVQLASSVLHDIPSNHLMTSECLISVKKN